jgi:hypothetical protein
LTRILKRGNIIKIAWSVQRIADSEEKEKRRKPE